MRFGSRKSVFLRSNRRLCRLPIAYPNLPGPPAYSPHDAERNNEAAAPKVSRFQRSIFDVPDSAQTDSGILADGSKWQTIGRYSSPGAGAAGGLLEGRVEGAGIGLTLMRKNHAWAR